MFPDPQVQGLCLYASLSVLHSRLFFALSSYGILYLSLSAVRYYVLYMTESFTHEVSKIWLPKEDQAQLTYQWTSQHSCGKSPKILSEDKELQAING